FGRVVSVDLIIDVEAGAFLYTQEIRYGGIAFEQYQQGCAGGGCLCDPAARPAALPIEGSILGLLELPSVLNHDLPPSVAPAPGVPQAPIPVFVDTPGGRVQLVELGNPADFETRESGYEFAAAVVYRAEPGWYEIGLAGGIRRVW